MPQLSPIVLALSAVASVLVAQTPVAAGDLLELPARPADRDLAALRKAIDDAHRKALRSRSPWTEDGLREKLPARLLDLDARAAKVADARKRAEALALLALAWSELAWIERIVPLEKAVREADAATADRLGHFAASEHFLARVVGAEARWADAALRLGEAARAGYLERFGFTDVSKVPGKRVRILIHVDASIERPRLYFHPSPLYHSELRYEVPDAKYLTLEGRHRIVYGFCHELGHIVCMWGQHGVVEDDKHAWAHYTGCLIVDEVYERLGNEPWPTWTSFQRRASGLPRLLEEVDGVTPGTSSREAILALFHRIGEEFGTDLYGKAWAWLEKKGRVRRVNNTPYLWLRDLGEALAAVVDKDKRARVAELFGER